MLICSEMFGFSRSDMGFSAFSVSVTCLFGGKIEENSSKAIEN